MEIFLKKAIDHLMLSLGESHITRSAYDTGWLARTADPLFSSKPLFPESIKWIIRNQRFDGSWGTNPIYYHDRIVCTLSAIAGLKRWGLEDRRVAVGKEYIEKNSIKLLSEIPTVAFEMIASRLTEDLAQMGVDIVWPASIKERFKQGLAALKTKKRDIVGSTLIHSIEALSKEELVSVSGEINLERELVGFSVAAASSLLLSGIRSYKQFKEIKKTLINGAAPVVSRFNNFERCWVLFNLLLAGVPFDNRMYKHLDRLFSDWSNEKGLGWAEGIEVKDLDDSSIAFFLLRYHDYPVSDSFVDYYERERSFVCFENETSRSVSHHANLMIASSLFTDKEKARHVQEKVLKFIDDGTHDGQDIWKDKWNISPAYGISRFILGLDLSRNAHNFPEKEYSLEIFAKDSHEEELGYICQAFESHFESKKIKEEACLWIEKCCFSPILITESFKLVHRIHKQKIRSKETISINNKSVSNRKMDRIPLINWLISSSLSDSSFVGTNYLARIIHWIFMLDDAIDSVETKKADIEQIVADVATEIHGGKTKSSIGIALRELLDFFGRINQEKKMHEVFRQSILKMVLGMQNEKLGNSRHFLQYLEDGAYSIGGPTVLYSYLVWFPNIKLSEVELIVGNFGKTIRLANDLASEDKELVEGRQNAFYFFKKNEVKNLFLQNEQALNKSLKTAPVKLQHFVEFVRKLTLSTLYLYSGGHDFSG